MNKAAPIPIDWAKIGKKVSVDSLSKVFEILIQYAPATFAGPPATLPFTQFNDLIVLPNGINIDALRLVYLACYGHQTDGITGFPTLFDALRIQLNSDSNIKDISVTTSSALGHPFVFSKAKTEYIFKEGLPINPTKSGAANAIGITMIAFVNSLSVALGAGGTNTVNMIMRIRY